MYGPCTKCGKVMCECPPWENRNLPFISFTTYLTSEDKIRLALNNYYKRNRKDTGCGWWLIGGREFGDADSDFESIETDYDTIKHYNTCGWSESPWSAHLDGIVHSILRRLEPKSSIDIEGDKIIITRNSGGKITLEKRFFDDFYQEHREKCRQEMREWKEKRH